MALHFVAELKLNADKGLQSARVGNGRKDDKDGLAKAQALQSLRYPLLPGTQARGLAYRSNDAIRRMVNAALHLRRPLLITGSPGSGKSSLIDAVAVELMLDEPLRWAVTSRSTVREAQYRYDAIARAQAPAGATAGEGALSLGDYIELGPLGTAMLPSLRPRPLLIDEIDKADIDLPNDLLNVLEEGSFHIPELSRLGTAPMRVRAFGGVQTAMVEGGVVASYEYPLVVMTSNGERDFPAPFLRRCLRFEMPDPCKEPARLREIVESQLGAGVLKQAEALIAAFEQRAAAGEQLATDQLLNAIQLVMGGYTLDEADRKLMVEHLTAALGRQG